MIKSFRCSLVLSSFALLVVLAPSVKAGVRLEHICKLAGQREIQLQGIGLVTGLAGTGDGGKNQVANRALQQMLKKFNAAASDSKDLKDAKNFALVQIQATIPATGIRPGQKINCYITSALGAKSLKGGRLMAAPLREFGSKKEVVVGIASGSVSIESADTPTVGKIYGGVIIESNFPSQFLDRDKSGLPIIRLLIDRGHASFYTASEVAREINEDFNFEKQRKGVLRKAALRIAIPRGAGVVEVRIPKEYYEAPVEFVSDILEIGIDNPNSQARVVINSRSGSIVISGEVEISPTLIAHPNLRIQIGNPTAAATSSSGGGFIALQDPRNKQNSQQLDQLLNALNELKVTSKDIIDIIRMLHRSGKLHAELIDE